ncbi:MAG: AI-2E family transporter [Geminicoccaceae bacterium]|nr:AI-2E family transporter [Geminicoccaceae bacterium]MCX8101134.1 AI-2E family transporter [Geminicoccaceae bacterium]
MPLAADRTIRTSAALAALVLVLAALYATASVTAPVAFALVVVALAWPLQATLERVLPKALALLATLAVCIAVAVLLVGSIAWGLARAADWLVANLDRFQLLYDRAGGWLEQHGLYSRGLLRESADPGRLLALAGELGGRLRDLASFTVVTLVFVALGLLEVEPASRRLARLERRELGALLLRGSAVLAAKLRRYMLVRTLVSALTGLAVGGFAALLGLELAPVWGVMAFTLNYLPFIGPLIATVLPTALAIVQFQDLGTVLLVLLGLNLVQVLLGSVLEPRLAGSQLGLSPFLVLLAVFFWALVWGLPGAFIGVPILIAIATFAAEYRPARWLAGLLGSEPAEPVP